MPQGVILSAMLPIHINGDALCPPQEPAAQEVAMDAIRNAIQHHCNPLHVYCRLRGLGLGYTTAHWLCRIYERVFFA